MNRVDAFNLSLKLSRKVASYVARRSQEERWSLDKFLKKIDVDKFAFECYLDGSSVMSIIVLYLVAGGLSVSLTWLIEEALRYPE